MQTIAVISWNCCGSSANMRIRGSVRAAIVLGLRNQGVFVERGLRYLVESGIVTVETDNNKIQLYSLTSNEPMRNAVFELVRLDWCQWQSVLRQMVDTIQVS